MGKHEPIAVGEKGAAQLLDLKPADFRSLVDRGILPRPRKVGPYERWDAEELRAVMRGEFVDGFQDVKW
jgi:hypothetical protein